MLATGGHIEGSILGTASSFHSSRHLSWLLAITAASGYILEIWLRVPT